MESKFSTSQRCFYTTCASCALGTICFTIVILHLQSSYIPRETVYKHDIQYQQYMKCNRSLRHTINSSLADIYQYDVPILISKGDIDVEEYRRLNSFENMMGLKGAKYADVVKALSVLDTVNNKYLFDDRMVNGEVPDGCVTCAVVGNGGILQGSRMGREIDAHDYVFRVNSALTKGFELDVGNKTSFYCFGMVTLARTLQKYKNGTFDYPPWNPGIRYVFMPDGNWAYRYIHAVLTKQKKLPTRQKWKLEAPKFRFPLQAKDIKLIHPDFSRNLEKTVMKSTRKTGRITTGGLMLLLALHTCDKVDAYGLLSDPKKYPVYYYDKGFKKTLYKPNMYHDWLAENRLWKRFIHAGVLNMYTRP